MSETREQIGSILQELADELAPDIQAGYLSEHVDKIEAVFEKRVTAARLEGMEAGGKMAADLKALAPVFKFYLPASVSEFDKLIAELEKE